MEENKEVKVKNDSNEKNVKESIKNEKMSYEQLENIAHQLSEQAKQLYAKLQEANMTNIFKRLDYLFKVIENSHAFSREFTNKCVAEIEDLMTIPQTEENTENKDK